MIIIKKIKKKMSKSTKNEKKYVTLQSPFCVKRSV